PLHLLVQNTAIPLVQTDRGGQITYHGTGQLVAYLLIDIKRRNWFVKDFVYHIETIMINTLAKFDVPAVRHENAPGVYLKIDQGQLFHELNGAKIGAIGLKIKQGCSYHGLSLNVAMDLQPFSWINPCGYAGLITTDMASINQAPPPLATHTTLENPPLSPILGEVLVQLQHQLSLPAPSGPFMSSEKPVTEHIIDTHLLLKHQKGQAKTARIPIPVVQTEKLPKPEWIRVKLPTGNTQFNQVKQILRERNLFSVCEEATCPNIAECFGKGTATFMIMGQQCTRRCPFCDVGHGRPEPLDLDEPRKLAEAIAALKLKYVVITSVDRDDLLDGGAEHFVNCIQSIRCLSPHTKIEILTPDFRGRMDRALDILFRAPPDVMNHNLETVPRLYKAVRP
ncbi:unnamed protein product, partial [Darwinula stevensoni]